MFSVATTLEEMQSMYENNQVETLRERVHTDYTTEISYRTMKETIKKVFIQLVMESMYAYKLAGAIVISNSEDLNVNQWTLPFYFLCTFQFTL